MPSIFTLVVLAAGAALRLWTIHAHPQIQGDSLLYGDIAANWLTHGIYGHTVGHGSAPSTVEPTLVRLPGYPEAVLGSAMVAASSTEDLGTLAGRMVAVRAVLEPGPAPAGAYGGFLDLLEEQGWIGEPLAYPRESYHLRAGGGSAVQRGGEGREAVPGVAGGSVGAVAGVVPRPRHREGARGGIGEVCIVMTCHIGKTRL